MRVRGVVALSMLAVAMACGGHTHSSMPDEQAGTGGTGTCICLQIGCSPGFEWVPDPKVCCAGECVLACDGEACSDIDLDCRPGMHVGRLPDECCPLCVPDNPPSCDQAMMLYQEYRSQRLNKYQSAGCQDGGCTLFSEVNRCAFTCGSPIASEFRDAIAEDLDLFAEQTCAACPKQFAHPCPRPEVSCIDNVCQTPPVPPQ